MAQYLTKIARYGIILFSLAWLLLYAMTKAIDIPTFHIDGTFQTASGLFRLNANQLPGKDFFPYLGIGPIVLLFPLFKLLGANLAASIISAQFMTSLTGVLVISLIWHLMWKPTLFSTSMMAGFMLYVMPITLASYFSFQLPTWFAFEISPGNSLRPIRAFAPYLWCLGYLFFVLKFESIKIKYAMSGVLSACLLLWSNDYSIPTVGLFSIFLALNSFHCGEFNLRNSLIYFFTLIFSWIIMFNLVTQGHALALLKYNFLDVANDQWWYFGSYNESARIFGISQLAKLFSDENYFPLIVLAATAIIALSKHLMEYAIIFWIGLVLFTGGAVATVGGHIGGYFNAFYFWGAITAIIFSLRFIEHFISMRFQKNEAKKKFEHILIFGLCLSILLATTNLYREYRLYLLIAKNDHDRFYVAELGGYLNREWKDYINLIRSTDSTHVIEEYWGVWSAVRKNNSIWPVDSAIAALGSQRKVAASKLQRADVIVTTRYQLSPSWQMWSLNQNYWLYEELMKNWTPYALSPATVVWRRNADARLFKKIDCIINKNSSALMLNTSSVGFYEVEVAYSFSGKGRFLLMAGNNFSFSESANGYVSLDPHGQHVKFPALIFHSGLTAIDVKVVGISKSNLNLIRCSARQISFANDDILHSPFVRGENT